jgi:DNA-binding NarL/FixJ family response regulator
VSDEPIRVLIVDDQSLTRLGIETLLNRKRDIKVVGHASNGLEAISQVEALDPDVVLMDIRMPLLDGVQATERLTAAGARAAVIIMTTFNDDADVFRGIAAGARGYLLKDADHRLIADAVRTVAGGNALLQPEVTAQVLREFRRLSKTPPIEQAGSAPAVAPHPPAATDLLTGREYEILRLLAQGQNNQEIGSALSISIGTVKNHISSILSKLGARDRIQAVLLAQQFGLI